MVLGIIPARAGSKGVLGKNTKLIAGKPLITWTIEAAKMSKKLDRLIVSTEDDKTADIAKEHGVEVLKRPVELAGDETSMLAVLQHVLSFIKADVVVLLQPTSPVRDNDLIDRCIKRFQEAGADSLGTGFICKACEYGTNTRRRQDLKGFFYDDGSVYVIKAELIKKGKLFNKKIEKFIISKEENIDIDDEFDFWIAEQILLKRAKGGARD